MRAFTESRLTRATSSTRSEVEQPSPGDPVLAGVTSLREPSVLLEAVRKAWLAAGEPATVCTAKVVQVHYKPYQRARLLIAVAAAEPGATEPTMTQHLFVQVFRTAAQARGRIKAADAKHALQCAGPAVFLLPDQRAVAWSLPNAPRLRAAKVGLHPEKLRKLLRKLARKQGLCPDVVPIRPALPQLIRYVPRRRALFRLAPVPHLTEAPLYIKVYEPRAFNRAKANLKIINLAASQQNLDFTVPKLVVSSSRRRALVMDTVPGESFTTLVNASQTDAYERVGRAIASLHASSVDPFSSWRPVSELKALAQAMRDVKVALPHLAQEVDETLAELNQRRPRTSSDERVPLHGNLFGDQLLVANNQVGLVDWDDLSFGDPMFDLGRLLAHLRFLAIRRPQIGITVLGGLAELLAAYCSRRGADIEWRRLEWHTQVALLMRAKISGLRPLTRTWKEELTDTLTLVHHSLKSGLDWVRTLPDSIR
ncbi:MAG: aminoglycoside phosphotransferase family protein [Planctomycetes bacterium]|nr:aminoglycoside phosphotransferase family protein [Planctomycetota bacterium]